MTNMLIQNIIAPHSQELVAFHSVHPNMFPCGDTFHSTVRFLGVGNVKQRPVNLLVVPQKHFGLGCIHVQSTELQFWPRPASFFLLFSSICTFSVYG